MGRTLLSPGEVLASTDASCDTTLTERRAGDPHSFADARARHRRNAHQRPKLRVMVDGLLSRRQQKPAPRLRVFDIVFSELARGAKQAFRGDPFFNQSAQGYRDIGSNGIQCRNLNRLMSAFGVIADVLFRRIFLQVPCSFGGTKQKWVSALWGLSAYLPPRSASPRYRTFQPRSRQKIYSPRKFATKAIVATRSSAQRKI